MQMGFADMLVDAINAALQDRKEALDGVGGNDLIAFVANIFVPAMVDGAMRGEVPADAVNACSSSVMRWLSGEAWLPKRREDCRF